KRTDSSPVSAIRTYFEVNGPYAGGVMAVNSATFSGYADSGHLGDSISTSVGLPIAARMSVTYADYFTLQSNILPIGAPVVYDVTYALHAGIGGDGSGFATSNAGYLTASGTAVTTIEFVGLVGDTTLI